MSLAYRKRCLETIILDWKGKTTLIIFGRNSLIDTELLKCAQEIRLKMQVAHTTTETEAVTPCIPKHHPSGNFHPPSLCQ